MIYVFFMLTGGDFEGSGQKLEGVFLWIMEKGIPQPPTCFPLGPSRPAAPEAPFSP